jgi:hypothetical protein
LSAIRTQIAGIIRDNSGAGAAAAVSD